MNQREELHRQLRIELCHCFALRLVHHEKIDLDAILALYDSAMLLLAQARVEGDTARVVSLAKIRLAEIRALKRHEGVKAP